MKDFAQKEFLNSQSNNSNLIWYIAGAVLILGSLLPLKHLMDRKDFRSQIEQSERIPYTFKKNQTIYTLCENEKLNGWKREECIDSILDQYPELRNRFVREGETILLPDIEPDGKVGY